MQAAQTDFMQPMHVPTIFHEKTKCSSVNTAQPFAVQREYVQALNFTKIGRLMAKPLVKAYSDSPQPISRIAEHANVCCIGSLDGHLFSYAIDSDARTSVGAYKASESVRGLCFVHENVLFSQGRVLCLRNSRLDAPLLTYSAHAQISDVAFCSRIYAATTAGIAVFDAEHSEQAFSIGDSRVSALSCCSGLLGAVVDGHVQLFDTRIDKSFRSIAQGIRTTALDFTSKPNYFVTANENSVLYLHDMRREQPITVFRHHAAPINDVHAQKAGPLVATASDDKTVRIFDIEKRVCTDVYHAQRMNVVSCVRFTTTGEKILSGSTDGSLRVWKAVSNAKDCSGPRERSYLKAGQLLKSKFSHIGEIRKIDTQRSLPRELRNKTRVAREMRSAFQRREQKVREKLKTKKEYETFDPNEN